MKELQSSPVRSSIVVQASKERTFSVFTEDIGSWWPPDHHLLEGPLAEMVFEPPDRVIFSWSIDLHWQLETDPNKTSEVEVRFVEEPPERTRVELEHRNLERHGAGWEQMHDAVEGPNGWVVGLQSFASRIAGLAADLG